MGNYVVYHLHSDLSNGVTNVDSVTKYNQYIERAKECGMTAMAFSEHGSIFEWFHKKRDIEAAGMKYIHAIEAYLTESLDEKVRDNYHCVLIARNYDGFLELNRLVSNSFNRKDNHFYYVPRISFNELFQTSDNIIVTTACVGGVLGKGGDTVKKKFLDFLTKNKSRCFLEIGHHIDPKQIAYNKMLSEISMTTGIPLIAGTDTHSLNETHKEGRSILQKAKNVVFEGEDLWDLEFKTYDELVKAYQYAYRIHHSVPPEVYLPAIENTNILAEMVEPFQLDMGTKYPRIYENPEETFRSKIMASLSEHKYALTNHKREELRQAIEEEFEVYKATKSIDFMLLQTYLREWERENDIYCGYGRGSVSGSIIAYLLGITQMDSLWFGLNFFRFLNPSRVTNADIDSDYSGEDRDKVKYFILHDKMNLTNIRTAEIITFNTIATKGAIRDVCRALYKEERPDDYMTLSDKISKLAESDEDKARKMYPNVFKYVDIVNGTIVSVGTHPSGVLISDLNIDETIGLCSTSTSDYPISMLNMKELDALMYVKLDILGLDNIGVINSACKLAGIERLTPDNIDDDDEAVWKSIRDDTTLIFQWESISAQKYIKKFLSDETIWKVRKNAPNFSMIKWLSFGNGLIRPACASFRDSVANGEFYDNGFTELNEFLAPEAGRIAMQETIMQFLVKFCGYSAAESDTVRRAIAKKGGTSDLLPEVERRFISYSSEHYDITEAKCREVIKPFLKIILDASGYSFSWNHSLPYSFIGYISGYLRYYYPLEFLTSALNIFSDDMDKTSNISKYAEKRGIKISQPKWGLSKGNYFFDRDKMVIAKGLSSVKYMNSMVAEELFTLAHSGAYEYFTDVLSDIDKRTSLNTRQLDILIKLDFFSEFGNQRELLRITEVFYDLFKKGEAKKILKSKVEGTPFEPIISKYSVGVTKSGGIAKSYTLLDTTSILHEAEDAIKQAGIQDLSEYIKAKNFIDIMGYVGYTSGREEDRKKLYVLEMYPAKRRKDGKQFGYTVLTKSVGSGKEGRFTVFNKTYDKAPIKKGDMIYCKSFERNGQYFTLLDYDMIY